jgi:hypothetical protein
MRISCFRHGQNGLAFQHTISEVVIAMMKMSRLRSVRSQSYKTNLDLKKTKVVHFFNEYHNNVVVSCKLKLLFHNMKTQIVFLRLHRFYMISSCC